jgi:hypothetical protein
MIALCKYGNENIEKNDIIIATNDINIETMNNMSEEPIDLNILLHGFILQNDTMKNDIIMFKAKGLIFLSDKLLIQEENIMQIFL